MCGRFALFSSVQAIIDYADSLNSIERFKENYNVAPGQKILAVTRKTDGNHLEFFKWGLIPFWAKDKNIGYKLINTRSETITEKPSFKYAFQKRRCLILANGFYEWRKKDKQPFYIFLKDRELFSFAGIWEGWKSPEGKEIKSCSIITTIPNEKIRDFHPRMPAILSRKDESKWLSNQIPEELLSLLKPYPAHKIDFHEVGKTVNSVDNNSQDLILPIME